MSKDAALYVALETGVMALRDGSEFSFTRGLTRVGADHEARKRAPAFFELVDPLVVFAPDGRRFAPQQ